MRTQKEEEILNRLLSFSDKSTHREQCEPAKTEDQELLGNFNAVLEKVAKKKKATPEQQAVVSMAQADLLKLSSIRGELDVLVADIAGDNSPSLKTFYLKHLAGHLARMDKVIKQYI